jgi:hypothetical protein
MLIDRLRVVYTRILSFFRLSRPASVKQKKKRKKIERSWNLKELLASLDAEHHRYKLKKRYSMISNQEWKALRNLGVFIFPIENRLVPRYKEDLATVPDDWKTRDWPNVMWCGFRHFANELREKEELDSDIYSTTSFFAIRQPQPIKNWRVEQTPGIPYLSGVTLELWGKELFWWVYVTVDLKGGTIHIPKTLHDDDIKLPKGGSYCRRSWKIPDWVGADSFEKYGAEHDCRTLQEYCEFVTLVEFVSCVQAWANRDDYYQVSSRKKKSRVTFCVAEGEQKYFFKDRDQTVLAADGKRKRIVHHVNEFTRKNGQHVKAHLRGIRRFRWNGYVISVKVPDFHFYAHDFAIPSVDEEDLTCAQSYIGVDEAIEIIADEEDTREYRHGRGARV